MTSPSPLDNPSVQRVQEALAAAGSEIRVRELADTARSAQEAADTLEVALGAIVKSLLFMAGEVPVMALVSGDRRCNTKALAGALAMPGRVRRAAQIKFAPQPGSRSVESHRLVIPRPFQSPSTRDYSASTPFMPRPATRFASFLFRRLISFA